MEKKIDDLTSTKKFKKSFCEKTAETLYHVYKKPYTNTNKFEASTSGQATSSSASQAVEPQASQVASVDSASRVVKPLETSPSNLTEYSQLQANEKVSTLARIASNPNSAQRALVAAVNINNNQENDPEQPINQWVRGQDRIIHLKNQSVSHRNFAALLLVEFFSEDTLNRENVNVLGRVSKGNEANLTNMVSLDQNLIKNIKRLVLDHVEGPTRVKEETWHDCIAAMNAKIAQLRKRRRIRDELLQQQANNNINN